MPFRADRVLVFAVLLGACAQKASPPPVVTVPTTDVAASAPPPVPLATDASLDPAAAPSASGGAADPALAADPEGVDPQFRACAADADCVAVEHLACCPNGRKVAVAVSQKDAYAQSFTCSKKRRICPQYRMLDRRVAYCDTAAKLCAMKNP
jgi:hypothetical protein